MAQRCDKKIFTGKVSLSRLKCLPFLSLSEIEWCVYFLAATNAATFSSSTPDSARNLAMRACALLTLLEASAAASAPSNPCLPSSTSSTELMMLLA
mmetsp:Transcript_19547/g.25974  ORF Transcript_19547/g.25974 Transcript_19547/m.25974 type:complete len:96 (+) Transcript_19547:376-663(+)